MNEYNHDDFEVLRIVDRFGGYEELRHKNQDIAAVCLVLFTYHRAHYGFP